MTTGGWIILDKPLGLGSTQAVAAVKRNLRQGGHAKVKVGHGGTLDPLATGVLPIGLGEATKLCGQMLDASKVYDFTIQFGGETDTLDAEGVVVVEHSHRPTLQDVGAILAQFTGPIEQMPPAYSALKVDGRRAYDLARAGEDVVLKSRNVEIFNLTMRAEPMDEPRAVDRITLSAHVSKGTYIRSLARDVARALGTVGHVIMLRRSRAGPFGLDQAISLDKLNEIGEGARLEDIILPLEAGLADIPALDLIPDQARRLQQGQVLVGIAAEDGRYWARSSEGTPLALVALEAGKLHVVRGFNL